jgi:hypothetical protein
VRITKIEMDESVCRKVILSENLEDYKVKDIEEETEEPETLTDNFQKVIKLGSIFVIN